MKFLNTTAFAALIVLTACGSSGSDADAPATPEPTKTYALEQVASGVEFGWSMAQLPDGTVLVTERPGRLRVLEDGALRATAVANVPAVYSASQGGLFDVLLAPDFETSRILYLAFAQGNRDDNGTSVVRARLSDDMSTLEDVTTIFDAAPRKSLALHFGGRLAFDTDGNLLVSLGDGFKWMDHAQQLDSHLGKIIRIKTTGGAADGNPFTGQDGAMPEIYSYGHRNVQGLVVDADGAVYAHEHGPKGGDEINVITAGANYGWPKITYGVNYDGTIISKKTKAEGMEQPVVKWVPSIAPSDMVLYQGAAHPEWAGDLLVSSLAGQKIVRIDLEDGQVVGEHVVHQSDSHRFRAIDVMANGEVYVTSDDSDGGVFKLVAE